MGITIVGLGPGDSRYLTREAWELLHSAELIYVRTDQHPVVAELPSSLSIRSFDAFYAESAEFGTVYQRIVETLMAEAQKGEVIYAVPGHPHLAEATVLAVEKAAKSAELPVRIVAGLSFVEPILTALHLDGIDGLQLFDAITLADTFHPPTSPDAPLLLGQLYNRMLASDLKLSLMAIYPPDHACFLIHRAGLPDQLVESLPLHAIDQSQEIHNLTALFVPPRPQISSLMNFAQTIAILRSPLGCPWDREQTPQSLRPSFLEEVSELVDALDQDDVAGIKEELGDVLLHLVMQAQIASEGGEFTLTDVIEEIDAKIKRRHPHVWGDAVITTITDLNKTWDTIKSQEKLNNVTASVLTNIPLSLSALARSQKIQKRVRKVGFDWPSIDGVWEKLAEEIAELQLATTLEEYSAELGDILFVLCNLALWLDVDAETALRETNLRFTRRFQKVEQILNESGKKFDTIDKMELIDTLWQQAKSEVG